MHIQPQALTHINPQVAELTKACGKYFVAGRQSVGECGFPASSAGGRKDEGRAVFGPKNFLQTRHDGVRELWEIWGTMVFHGHHHGALNALWHVGRTGDK